MRRFPSVSGAPNQDSMAQAKASIQMMMPNVMNEDRITFAGAAMMSAKNTR
jgi:hypothetical protein